MTDNTPTIARSRSKYQARFNDVALPTIMDRRRSDGPLKAEMASIAERVNGDYVVPLTNVQGEPAFPQIAASIITGSIESAATRANDMEPVEHVPVLGNSDLQRKQARMRAKAWAGGNREDLLPLKRAKAFRHLAGYGNFCMTMQPLFGDRNDRSQGRATLAVRNPLTAYAEPTDTDEIRRPRNVAFVYGRTGEWLAWRYPDSRALVEKHSVDSQELWDVVEWTDEDMVLIGILGLRAESTNAPAGMRGRVPDRPSDQSMLIHAYDNRVGHVPTICPTMVSFDKQFSNAMRAIPVTDLHNKVTALNYMAAEKAVFPDRYVIGRDGFQPKIVGGQWRDGATGQVNLLQDVASIGELQSTPGPLTPQLMADLERNARDQTGHSGMMSGELNGSLRSGSTVNALQGVSIDPRTKEDQRIMAFAQRLMNESRAEIEKAYFPTATVFAFTGWPGDDSHIEYQPAKLWTDTRNDVDYPMPGMTSAEVITMVINLVQTGLMSEETGRVVLPWIRDSHAEGINVSAGMLRQALIGTFSQGVAQGATPLTDAISVLDKVEKGTDFPDAILEAQEEAQARQVEEAPPGGPGQVADPATAPGLNQPGAGGEQPAPAPPGGPGGGGPGLEEMLAAFQSAPPGAA